MLPGPREKIFPSPITGGFSFYTHTGLCVEFCAPAIFNATQSQYSILYGGILGFLAKRKSSSLSKKQSPILVKWLQSIFLHGFLGDRGN